MSDACAAPPTLEELDALREKVNRKARKLVDRLCGIHLPGAPDTWEDRRDYRNEHGAYICSRVWHRGRPRLGIIADDGVWRELPIADLEPAVGLVIPPYRLADLLAAPPSQPVVMVSDERIADQIAAVGILASCSRVPGAPWGWLLHPIISRPVIVLMGDGADERAVAARIIRALLAPHSDNLTLGRLPETITAETITAAARAAKRVGVVDITSQSHAVDETMDMLATDETLYVRGGCLTACDEAGIRALSSASVAERIARVAILMTDRGQQPVPRWLADMIRDRGIYPPELRELRGVVTWPLIRADGSIYSASGYDRASRMLCRLDGLGLGTWPAQTTQDEAIAAARTLTDIVCDFPFANRAHRSGWLAELLTVLGRHLIDGPTPIMLYDAPTPGSGKSLLARITSIIATGQDAHAQSLADDEAERRKMLTAALMEARPVLLLDNQDRKAELGGSALEAVATATRWRDRILGSTRMIECDLLTTVIATGNNIRLSHDMRRRVLMRRLIPDCEQPELRSGWRYPDIIGHVKTHRAELLRAALTILRGWIQWSARGGSYELAPWGSYEAWSALIRSALVWAWQPDPAITRDDIEPDYSADADARLLHAWRAAITAPVPARYVAERLYTPQTVGAIKTPLAPAEIELRAAIDAVSGRAPDGQTGVSAHRLGLLLRRLRDRVIDGLKLTCRRDRINTMVWAVEDVPATATVDRAVRGIRLPADGSRYHVSPYDGTPGGRADEAA